MDLVRLFVGFATSMLLVSCTPPNITEPPAPVEYPFVFTNPGAIAVKGGATRPYLTNHGPAGILYNAAR